jgi:hypothetical protein
MSEIPRGQGRLAENVMHFSRLLRAAGLPIGPDRVLDDLAALRISGIERRDDLYWTLAAVFLDRHDRLTLFDEAFRMFWRDPELGVRALRLPPNSAPSTAPAPVISSFAWRDARVFESSSRSCLGAIERCSRYLRIPGCRCSKVWRAASYVSF